MSDRDGERAAIRAAMERLLTGTAYRSTGALSIMQLAAEAGVKRWLLTHKHTDLAQEFRHRARGDTDAPTVLHRLEQRARTAEESNRVLQEQNSQLRAQLAVYAQVIHELRSERTRETDRARLEAVKWPVE
ncbi:hypothetical protein [Nocardia wallacei]|uniref:Uncharacterized protein n=1 Tax=Nocardia wallacei TaxID=480035 RepID=A0A7G1KLU1_9NOCA|nr:hypothetical protein [Nocardia wallacei]BCK56205.1 hypothetical protein NWFMUON74_39770 [Nocardia wallacei]